MALPVATAAPGGWEGPLVSGLDRSASGVTVVRRCVDVPELLACAAAGQVRAALVAADLRRLDTEVLARLAAAGVAVVGLTRTGDDPSAATLRRLGVARLVAADADPVDAAGAVGAAVADLVAKGTRTVGGDADPAAALPDAAPRPDRPPGPEGSSGRDRSPGEDAAARREPAGGAPAPAHDPDDAGAQHTPATLDAMSVDAMSSDAGSEGPASRDGDRDGDRDGAQDRHRARGGDEREDGGDEPGRAPGLLVAVWGPAGSPGRTTVAATLATELADLAAEGGDDVLLADADTWAASLAQVLGVLDEAPGLAAACRAAGHGSLDVPALARATRVLRPGLRLLTGISRSSRWPEIGATALDDVWRVARTTAAWTVVDCGASLEQDEELSYDVAAPRRNAATLVTLAAADVVVAVGAADPVGVQRLVRGLQDLRETVPHVTPRVVLTRVRAGAVGGSPRRRLLDALARYAGVRDAVLVPDDRPALDAALLAGRTLTEHAPTSPARLALARMAADLVATAAGGRAADDRTPGRRRRRRR